MDIAKKIAEELEIKVTQVEAAVKLIDEGCTIPFIARYRKEVTGALNDEQLRNLDERLKYLRNLEDRKAQVLASIEEQGKLTEFIYAQEATEDVEVKAAEFISDEEGKEVATAQDAIAGALDIIAEQISDVADYRTYIRDITMKEGKLVVTAKDEKAESVYENYYDYSEALSTIPGHRILAINRGEDEKFLTVKVEAPEERILRYLEKNILKDNAFTAEYLKNCIADAYGRLIAPAIE